MHRNIYVYTDIPNRLCSLCSCTWVWVINLTQNQWAICCWVILTPNRDVF